VVAAPRQHAEVALTEESAIELMTEMRRDMLQEINWQLQRGVPRRGPTGTETALALGSLATGAIITVVLIANSTTVVSGILDTQSASHANVLPFVVVVWLAVLTVNAIWARRV
jgi:hypothetical protein